MPQLSFTHPLSLILAAGLLWPAADAQAQRLSARDKVAALEARMVAAEKRYADALPMARAADPAATRETDAALEDMEDVLTECVALKGCRINSLLPTYKRLLKGEADVPDAPDELGIATGPVLADPDHVAPLVAEVPEAGRAAELLNDHRHAFDEQVHYNAAVQAGIRRWLTDWRPQLLTSLENYLNLRPVMWPEWEKRGLPEALLFGIMAKESNGRVHATSRAGAAGLMQFMPATGRRFGLGPDGSGFDTRYDARSAAEASGAYMLERMRALDGNIEMALAAYNGGEGRAQRVWRESGGASFWSEWSYHQFPAETRDYVPMVIAAAWIFLHPQQYGIDMPRVNAQPTTFQLARSTTIYELTICLGSANTRDGHLRALRNLNPRYAPDGWIPAGTVLNGTARIAALYQRYCASGPRADLARALVGADVNAAIERSVPLQAHVAVGDVEAADGELAGESALDPRVMASSAVPVPAVVQPRNAPAMHTVVRGDNLGAVARRYSCDLPRLARANGLRAPAYALKPGQRLKLEGCKSPR